MASKNSSKKTPSLASRAAPLSVTPPPPSSPAVSKPADGQPSGKASAATGKGSGSKASVTKGASAKGVASGGSTPPAARASKPPPRQIAAPAERPRTLEERTSELEKRLRAAPIELQDLYRKRLDMSWIYHDSAIEGVVYTEAELDSALGSNEPVVVFDPIAESNTQPVLDEIRRHRDALNFIRDLALQKQIPIDVDLIRKLYFILHPEEGDVASVRYRKDIPQHRLYFHEYAAPDKIPAKVRAVVDWLNDPENRKSKGGLRMAVRAHYDLLRVFPFQHDSGKVARLLLNLLLLRGGYPPAIVHMSERQRYYDAVKGSAVIMNQIVHEAVDNNLKSIQKMLDLYETRT